ncbi:golgi-associated PDZ and coiled-coil motif-containing protein-like [Tropilaelaps mercedesae]|uniref:Golgi-associated PDZ and coiled-coil motif-containing protein-like n=1 Tax=Tropilaelaps mercedesae TaxID=418985 RepID=A0A1V9X2H2_9ACAR|nr:golgi-associated PDZ and coiled-coil motif-containing protein-like [Tropilaelaps mercedesae]
MGSTDNSASPGRVALKWVQLLEKEFDKVYIELDSMLGDLEEEHQPLCYQGKELLSAMCAAFGQLVHKALAVCELNVKLQTLNELNYFAIWIQSIWIQSGRLLVLYLQQ